ncbi:hypothetical protein Shyhy02_09910 [Streptomyces hygroscopicus subsp. hygroscopicus]|nr:hypothetical protein Shyhy02_09910 [Streptomyces hygroscopicus subsp. hygroscopicus]
MRGRSTGNGAAKTSFYAEARPGRHHEEPRNSRFEELTLRRIHTAADRSPPAVLSSVRPRAVKRPRARYPHRDPREYW